MLKRYDVEFKTSAVQLVISSGKSHKEIAKDLGSSQSTLSRLVHNHHLGRSTNLSSTRNLNEHATALKEALKELAIVREERDILKKALGIFSLPLRK